MTHKHNKPNSAPLFEASHAPIHEREAYKQGEAGHPDLSQLSSQKLNEQINKKMRENILSGRFYPETEAEKRMVREHRAKQL